MMRHAMLAVSSAAMLASAAPANALAAFDGFSYAEFGWSFEEGASVAVSSFVDVFDQGFSESGTGVVTDLTPGQSETAASVTTSGSVAGQASAPLGAASAFLLTDGFVSFENTGTAAVTLSYSWEIFGLTRVLVDDPTTEAAEVGAFATIFGELFDSAGAGTVLIDVERFAFSIDFLPEDGFDQIGSGDVTLGPGEAFEVFMTADQEGFAEAAVPLPAAAPLLLAGLAALGAAAARRRR